MAKKSATYLGYEVVVEDNNSITINKDGQKVAKVMGAIREIAALTGFVVNEKSNTQQNGSKLVDFLKTLPATAPAASTESKETTAGKSESASEIESETEHQATVPKCEIFEAEIQPSTTSEIELNEEEMNELLKRLEALEARIAKLENALATGASASQDREYIVAYKRVTQQGYSYNTYKHYFKTSKGRILEDLTMWGNSSANYLETLKNALIGIGDEGEIKAGESIETFLARIRAKYNPDQALPTLLGGYVLFPSGTIVSIKQSNKNIKF